MAGFFDDHCGEGLLSELTLYLRLAHGFKQRWRMADRDRALLMAACCAELNQMPAVAEFCRRLILQNNHGHMVRRWASMGQALQNSDFLHFIRQVRRKLPLETAEARLVETGYECDVRRPDYNSDDEFVAAVMGIDAQWLDDHFG